MTRKAWNLTIKASLALLFAGMLAWQVFRKQQAGDLWGEFLAQGREGSAWLLLVLGLLMPVNWILETVKWRIYLPADLKVPFHVCLKSVMAGVTLSLLTPNRIGEYGGRVLFVPEGRRWDAAIATMAGSFAQNLVQVLMGATGFFIFYLLEDFQVRGASTLWLVLLCGGMILLTLFYFRIDLIYRWTKNLRFPRFLEQGKQRLRLLATYRRKDLLRGLVIAGVRYFVFCFQFVLALQFFGLAIPLPYLFWGVTLIYLFHSGVPLPPFIDIMARSQIALIIWQQFEPNELSVISASFSIWMINLVIPAIFGLIAIEQLNVMKILGFARKNEST